MSANNKTICPKCKQIKDVEFYNPSLASLDWTSNQSSVTLSVKPLQSTLSENYEIHTDEYGVLMIKYDCYCSVCDFEFSYTNYVNVLES